MYNNPSRDTVYLWRLILVTKHLCLLGCRALYLAQYCIYIPSRNYSSLIEFPLFNRGWNSRSENFCSGMQCKNIAERDSWMQQRDSGGNFAPAFVFVVAQFIRPYSSFVFCLSLVLSIPQEIWVPKEDYGVWCFIENYYLKFITYSLTF
jgi:hypothetical protein